jgi:transcriptional regulator with XRE-family HTH domain
MADDDLPVLPGFREMALSARRQKMLAELVAERHAAGLSQSEVADRMGTSQPAVARVEAGAVDVRLSTLQRYAAAVGRRLELRLADQRSHRPSPRTVDSRTVDSRTVDSRAVDSRAVDSRTVDSRAVDSRAADEE